MCNHPSTARLAALVLILLTAGAAAAASERDLEASIVHRSISLDGVRSWSRKLKRWQPLPPSRAKVRVINLWSKVCVPCLAELPDLAELAAEARRSSGGAVEFLFIADPPDQTAADDVVRLWTSPYVDALANRCPGTRMQNPATNAPSCLLRKEHVPDLDPAYRDAPESKLIIMTPSVEIRPITLLVDESGTIRQAFVGSLTGRKEILRDAIQRLLATSARSSAQSRHAAASHSLQHGS